MFFRKQIRREIVQVFIVVGKTRLAFEVCGPVQVPQLVGLDRQRRPVHGIGRCGNVDELHIIHGQGRFQRRHDVHDARLRRKQPTGVDRAADIVAGGEGNRHAEVGGHSPIDRDGPHLSIGVAAINGKLVRGRIAATALHDPDGQLGSGLHAARDGDERAGRIADALHRPHRAAHEETDALPLFQRGVLGEQERGPGRFGGLPDGQLRGSRLRRAEGRPAVRRHLDRRRADLPGGDHFNHDIGVFLRHAGDGCGWVYAVPSAPDRSGDVTALLPPHGDRDHHGLLPGGGQHVAELVHQRPDPEQPGQIGTGTHKVRLADLPFRTHPGDHRLTVDPAGREPAGAVDQVFEYVSHLQPPAAERTSGQQPQRRREFPVRDLFVGLPVHEPHQRSDLPRRGTVALRELVQRQQPILVLGDKLLGGRVRYGLGLHSRFGSGLRFGLSGILRRLFNLFRLFRSHTFTLSRFPGG